jgi:hypothetical protein
MIGIVGMLAKAGFDYLADTGEDIAKDAVKKATGIDLNGKTELSVDEIAKIKGSREALNRELELLLKDKADARAMSVALSQSDSWLLKNTGSMIGMFTVVISFVLFGLILAGFVDMSNPSVSLVVGFAGGYITQILSFYFGATKNK